MMTHTNDETISVLNGLVETCKDGYEGFKSAADAVKTSHLKSLFSELAEERASCASKLQAEVASLGGTPEKHGSATAALHRGWLGLKGAITGGDEHAVVAECERGEDFAVAEFRKALEKNLGLKSRPVVEEVYRKIQNAHDRVRSLEVKTDR